MGGHKHAEKTVSDFASEREWAEWVKDYYRDIEEYDWVDVADNVKGLESFFHRNRRRAVRAIVKKYGSGEPMLDAGCGTGLNLAGLPPGSTGIDLNPRNLALIRQRLPQHKAVLGDVEAMPFADGSFGTVLCTEVLEHVPYPEQALREIRRVLRPGGFAILQVPVAQRLEVTREDRSIRSDEQREEAYGQRDHVRLYGLDYPRRLEEAGFEVHCDSQHAAQGEAFLARWLIDPREVLYRATRPA